MKFPKNMNASRPVDPVQLEITRNRWCGIAEEACAAMIRASYSPNIRDRRDCSTALSTIDGQIVAQAEVGTPLDYPVITPIGERPLRAAVDYSLKMFSLNQGEYAQEARNRRGGFDCCGTDRDVLRAISGWLRRRC